MVYAFSTDKNLESL